MPLRVQCRCDADSAAWCAVGDRAAARCVNSLCCRFAEQSGIELAAPAGGAARLHTLLFPTFGTGAHASYSSLFRHSVLRIIRLILGRCAAVSLSHPPHVLFRYTLCLSLAHACPVPCTPVRLHAVTPKDRSQFRGHGRMQGTLAARCTSPARCFPARVGSCAYTCSLATACSCHC